MTGKLRVLVVDDDDLMRAGVRTLLDTEPDIEVTAAVADGDRALVAYGEARPHVVVLDLRMPGMDGVVVTRRLLERDPGARILILSYHQGDQDVFEALRAGALGYLPKGVDASEFLFAVRAVAEGKRYFHSEIAGRLVEGSLDAGLSRRELQVLESVAEGLTNPQIAERLKLSRRTVGMFVSRVLAKLGASTRTEAVAIAIRKGVVRPPR